MDPQLAVFLVFAGIAFIIVFFFIAFVSIAEDQVGVIVKKFSFSELPPGKVIALNGESGYS